MLSIEEKLNQGLKIFKNNLLLILIICLISALLTVAWTPWFVKNNLPEEAINQQISISFGGIANLSSTDIINALVWILQFLILSTALFVIAYIVKRVVDKRLFSINKWRDWRFLIYASALPIIEIDVWEKLNMFIGLNYKNDLLINLVITFIFCFLTIILTTILFPPELIHEDPKTMIENMEIENHENLDKIDKLGNNHPINNPQTAGIVSPKLTAEADDKIRPAEDKIIKL